MPQYIRITSTPPGQAPEWVRKEWVGVEIPVKTQQVGLAMGALGGEPEAENLAGYHVNAVQAVSILAQKSPDAAEWWWSNVFDVLLPESLLFARRVCELIEK